jgi:HEAT repeat protein
MRNLRSDMSIDREVLEQLRSDDASVRYKALKMLDKTTNEDDFSNNNIKTFGSMALHDEHPNNAEYAARMLAKIGGKEVYYPLLGCLLFSSHDLDPQLACAEALLELEVTENNGVKLMIEIIQNHTDNNSRFACIVALGSHTDKEHILDAVNPLISVLNDETEEPATRCVAASTLSIIHDNRALEHLRNHTINDKEIIDEIRIYVEEWNL